MKGHRAKDAIEPFTLSAPPSDARQVAQGYQDSSNFLGHINDGPRYLVKPILHLAMLSLGNPSYDPEELTLPQSSAQPGVVPSDAAGLPAKEPRGSDGAIDQRHRRGDDPLAEVHGQDDAVRGNDGIGDLSFDHEMDAEILPGSE